MIKSKDKFLWEKLIARNIDLEMVVMELECKM